MPTKEEITKIRQWSRWFKKETDKIKNRDNINMRELATRTSFSHSSISNWRCLDTISVNDRRFTKPSEDSLKKLCENLDLDLEKAMSYIYPERFEEVKTPHIPAEFDDTKEPKMEIEVYDEEKTQPIVEEAIQMEDFKRSIRQSILMLERLLKADTTMEPSERIEFHHLLGDKYQEWYRALQ